ncbi:MAG: hypothetical protein AB8B96_12065 [Lysobacterales bacterium]
MRIIGLLLALLVIAYLINQQLGSTSQADRSQELELDVYPGAPTVPTKPADVEQFGQDMQQYLDDKAKERVEAIDEASEG